MPFQKGNTLGQKFRVGHKPSPEVLAKLRQNSGMRGRTGELHPAWKGDAVGYRALHEWVESKLGKPKKCAHCGAENRVIQWANKSKRYLRDITDWIELCVPCHRVFDGVTGSKRNVG